MDTLLPLRYSKGMLVPRMTQTEIAYIVNPVDGLIVYNTSNSHLYTYNESTGGRLLSTQVRTRGTDTCTIIATRCTGTTTAR